MRQKLDFERLKEYCFKNSVKLLLDYSNKKIIGETVIKGKCCSIGCEDDFNKKFRELIYKKGGPFCKECVKKSQLEKVKSTCLEKYGTESHFNSDVIKEKIKTALLNKYNCESVFKNQEIRDKIKTTVLKKYGTDSIMKSSVIKEKIKNTFLNRYGCDNPGQIEKTKEKIKETCLSKYGFKNVAQNAVVKEKIKKTNIERYGYSTPFQNETIKQKIRNTNLEKYGCENPMQSVLFRDKVKQSCFSKYGCENAQQNAIISERTLKSSYKTKQYTLPSGNVLQLQGYEPYAINDLLNIEKLSENDIITSRSEVPETWYIDETGKKHRYFVDIYIPNQKRCVEVKSVWTMKQNPKIIFDKQAAIKNNGYSCEIWVYNNKGERLKKYD